MTSSSLKRILNRRSPFPLSAIISFSHGYRVSAALCPIFLPNCEAPHYPAHQHRSSCLLACSGGAMLHQTVAKRFVERRNSSFTPTDPQMTLVTLGASKVGKTTIMSQYLWKQFEVDYKPTIEEFHWIEYEKENNNLFILQLIDSSGSHDFLAMRQLYYKTGDAFLIVFSLENLESWEEAKDISTQLLEQRENGVPIFLVANKLDKNPDWNDHHVRNFCEKNGIKFAAISAFDEEQVTAIFDELLDQLRANSDLPQLSQLKKRRQSMPTPNRGSVVSTLDVEQINKSEKRSCIIA